MIDGKIIKKRIVPAIAMILSGAAIYIGSVFYNSTAPQAVVTETAAEDVTDDVMIIADNLGNKKIIYKTEEGWSPSPDELNLAHIFPEDADTTEISESYGGMAFNSLVRHESSWWSQVYSSAGMTPAQLAAQLGRDTSSVYSSSGEVKSFKSIHMNVVNGDGTPVNLKSNIIQIMSMANVYMYYHDPLDYDAFLDYCTDLFDRSHSYSVSMSGVYYCDGSCQNSSIDSEEFDEDFFTYDTNFDLGAEGTEPLSYLYEPIYETEAETESADDGSNVIIQGDARAAYEESLASSVGPTVAETEAAFDEYDDYYESTDVIVPDHYEDDTPEETQREIRSRVLTTEEEAVTLSEEEALAAAQAQEAEEAQAAAQAQAAAESQAAAEAQAVAQAQALAESAAESRAAAEALAAAQAQAVPEDVSEDVVEDEPYVPETESQAPVIHAGESHTEAYAESEGLDTDNTESYEDDWEMAEEYGSEIVEYQDASASDAETGESESDSGSSSSSSSGSSRRTTARCPGHIDLTINIRIYDLDGEKNLYSIDVRGNTVETEEDEDKTDESGSEDADEASDDESDKASAETENSDDKSEGSEEGSEEDTDKEEAKLLWPGWTEEQRAYVVTLSSKDWYEEYGLSLSTFSFGNPLTPSEIKRYMAMLPDNLSDTRKKVIEFALQSVGRVPYYWGGKASYAGYDGNNFGMLISPDQSGRVLKGLDCSGWVGWVYWSVTGEHAAESTGTLADMGQAISLNQMQPGDIAVRTGSSAHVIMFLGWAEDGNILCIHESSAGVNNVTIAERSPSWPYYRSIFD